MAPNKITYHGASRDQENRVKGSEIFVGGLPRSTTERTICEIFSPYGEIVEVRMMKDQNGTSKGFCFVRFSTREAAFRALKEKDGSMLHGKKIGIEPSSDQDSLFFGNLRKDWSTEEFDRLVRQAFRDVVSVDLAMPSSSGNFPAGKKRQNRGFGFVKFSSHAAAARAQRVGSKPDFLLGGDWHPVIDWVEAEPMVDPEELTKIKTAFVGNLPTNADESYLKELFESIGKVERVALSRKGRFPVGFVHFTNRIDLDRAIKELDGRAVQGPQRGPSFKIQVTVAKPAEKERKRVRDEVNIKPSNAGPLDSFNYKTKAPRLENVAAVPADPYEEAVLALPSAVMERLLQVFRLGVATRYDVDIKCITSLQDLPESSAIAVLDQFLASGADKHDKGAHFVSLVARNQVDKLALQWNRPHVPRKSSELQPNEFNLLSSRPPPQSQAIDSLPDRYNSYTSSPGLYPYSTTIPKDPYFSRPNLGKLGEASYRNQHSTAGGYGAGSSASLNLERPVERPQVRFDPFTGQPYKFDPFTGEPIRPE